MGPDEQSTSKYGMIITPINEDGTYGEPVKWAGLKPITEWPESTVIDYGSIPLNDENKPLLVTSWSGEFNVKFRHKKISKKTFKKWLMARGVERNLAERFCQIIGSFHGGISYQRIYTRSLFFPMPEGLFTNILDEAERIYSWTKK